MWGAAQRRHPYHPRVGTRAWDADAPPPLLRGWQEIMMSQGALGAAVNAAVASSSGTDNGAVAAAPAATAPPPADAPAAAAPV